MNKDMSLAQQEGSQEKGAGKERVNLRFLSVLSFALLLVFTLTSAFSQGLSTSDTYRDAYEAGYKEGVEAGKEDKERKRLFDLANKKAFQMAGRTLDTERHDLDVYRVGYRRGFKDGYEEGYGVARKKPAYNAPPISRTHLASPPDRSHATAFSGKRVGVPIGTRIKVSLFDTLSTRRNVRGDTFRARVIKEIKINGNTVIPKKTWVLGTIGHLKRAGRISGRSEMSLQFEELQFTDGSKSPIQATVVSISRRDKETVRGGEGTIQGRGSKSRDLKTIGKASGVATLIGVLTGRKKGAAIGAAAGAIIGLASVLSTRGRDMVLHPKTELTIELNREALVPVSLQPAREAVPGR